MNHDSRSGIFNMPVACNDLEAFMTVSTSRLRFANDDSPAGDSIDVTIVIPMRNEETNVSAVCSELQAAIDTEPHRYEVIIINDGSSDGTSRELQKVAQADSRFTVVEFARGFGQSAALAAGFRMAQGRVVVAMDGDRQNDPRDIPALVAKLDESPGYDVVSGWRKERQDKWFSRRLPSIWANALIRRRTWCPEIHDFGCTLKAYRLEVLEDIRLYGEMHRFLPAICKWRGARLAEVVVNHRPRVSGTTKYGISRTIRVLLDLMTVKFLGDYVSNPLYLFGKLALLTLATAFAAVALAIVQKFGYLTEHGQPVMLNNNVLIIFAMMAFLTTCGLLMMGLMSELLTRIYHESQDRPPYRIRHVWRAIPPRQTHFPGTSSHTSIDNGEVVGTK
jgi:glycosyltransferase involved in cell wall biosynthesis